DAEPETADFLAQASQDGGGDSPKPKMAQSPLPSNPVPNAEQTPPVARIQTERANQPVKPPPKVVAKKTPARKKVVEPKIQPEPVQKPENKTKLGLIQTPQSLRERARLSAEISQFWDEYQKRPRRKFLSARTKEYKFAAYMEAWRAKVERVGNLNYPEQAKRQKLTGNLVLDVEINPNGTIRAISVIRPSGHKVLDDAAMRIVRLSAPFSPFPPNIRKDVDILHITRTWQFLRGNRLTSR
ncbi:MAG: TonB family protein, partial [Gammaproteobacteria bacterium]|nr:TonB family protein [Gammaproteobacteria bacterium]